MIKSLENRDYFLTLVIGIVLLLHSSLVTAETIKSWAQLAPMQQEALQPLATQWNTLSTKLQRHLLRATKQYPNLTPDKKKLFLTRLEKWSKLTPEQRERARQNYLKMKIYPPQKILLKP